MILWRTLRFYVWKLHKQVVSVKKKIFLHVSEAQSTGLRGAGCRRKQPLDRAVELLSKIWQHITTFSFVLPFTFVMEWKFKILTHHLHIFQDIQNLRVFYKHDRFLTNWLLKCGLSLLKEWLYLALDYVEKKIDKKYQKPQSVMILWPTLRPKQAILINV